MPDKPTFVVNDRRKFTAEGELRHEPSTEAANTPAATIATELAKGPQLVTEFPIPTPSSTQAELADLPESDAVGALQPDRVEDTALGSPAELPTGDTDLGSFPDDPSLPPGPTPEQSSEARRAYEATAERLDTAMRATNPGADHLPPMNFERLVQSLYTQALILLGGGAQPGETPRVDILGAKETIDMLTVLADKSKTNLTVSEEKLLQSALFDLHMGFLEITQALARQAAQRGAAANPAGMPPIAPGGPRIVR